MKKPIIIASVLGTGLLLSAAGCTSDADQASKNISTAAEQFEVQRHIIGVNGITDKYAFEVVGRCSIETADSMVKGALEVTCKHGPNDFRKHYLGPSDNVYWVATQMDGIDVSVYHTRILIKPENVLPEFDLQTGKQ
jgi:hypothetical protein